MVSRLSLVRTAPVSTTAATTTPGPLSTLHGDLRLCALPESGSGAVNGYQRRSTVKYGTCLKIMVSPVRVRVPPLKKYLQNIGKPKRLESSGLTPTYQHQRLFNPTTSQTTARR